MRRSKKKDAEELQEALDKHAPGVKVLDEEATEVPAQLEDAKAEVTEWDEVWAVLLLPRHLYNRYTNEHIPFGRAAKVKNHPWLQEKAERENVVMLFSLEDEDAAHTLAKELWTAREEERKKRLAGNIRNEDGSWAIPEQ